MNTLLLEPTDVLFFSDGRPMSGSLSGHGAAWPLPTVTNAALHAALHRAELEKILGGQVHRHDHRHRDGNDVDARKFGCLTTAGPFPVKTDGESYVWLFPRPFDAGTRDSTTVSYAPLPGSHHPSSLPAPLKYPVENIAEVTKEVPAPWWNTGAWNDYLGKPSGSITFKTDLDFSRSEYTIGIGIDPETSTQNGERFYSAQYLRLLPGWRLGLLSEARDKIDGNPANRRDLLHTLFPKAGTRTPVIVGGQQRLCTVVRENGCPLPLPVGNGSGFITFGEGEGKRWLVKWVLLTPAIFPQVGDHHGGWLPSWTDLDGRVQLLDGPGKNHAHRHKVQEGKRIAARLVAAMVGKPVTVTGYALPDKAAGRKNGGAKSLHLAVPAGSVYYFECDPGPEDDCERHARNLAAALNWHGSDLNPATIRNRRSTLMGEKGFGLGVCGTWAFSQNGPADIRGHPAT